ncbi:MAG: cyclic nucleotide-binding domain-containing protein [Gemmataceae bacterium]|nr:cyclic nucleotide-binding domain-containing protein [Gemmataceae bacterium]
METLRELIKCRYPLLNVLPEQAVDNWLASGQETIAAPGETLFREGSLGGWAYLLREGRIRVLRAAPSGGDLTVGFLGPGDLFGEYALVPPHRSTATCRTVERSRFVRLALGPLKSILPEIAAAPRTIKRWLRLHALVAYLRDRSFLGFMSAETALEFLEDLTSSVFRAGQTIQSQRLGNDVWHFIESGEVMLHSEAGVRRIAAGESFGEEALACVPIVWHAEAIGDVRTRSLAAVRFLPSEEGKAPSQQTLAGALPRESRWVGQETPSDCGFASLAMACGAWNRPAPSNSLREQISSQGLSMSVMKDALAELGFAVRAVRIDAAQLRNVNPPAILLLRDHHYVVLFDANPDGVTIGDPATAIVQWSWPALESQFSGFALLPHPIG